MADPYRYFRIEAAELLGELEKGVAALRDGTPAAEVVARLLRSAHTLKGAARVVKRPEIADQAHALEDALAPYRDLDGPLSADRLQGIGVIVGDLRERVAALPPPPGADPTTKHPQTDDTLRTVRSDVSEIDELLDEVGETYAQLGVVRNGVALIERARDLTDLIVQQLAPRHVWESGKGSAGERVRSIAIELREVTEALGQSLGKSVDRVDRHLQQVRATTERLRLETAAVLFADAERAARDVAQAQGKRLVFQALGGEVRLDAHLVAAVQPALNQLVRNAVAHGIESEAERRTGGKPPEGRVTLSVSRRGRHVVFGCRDDGRGVDLEAVRAKVGEKNLPSTATESHDAEELVRLLLKGGISTSGTVTEVSGRGIGLDIVRDSATRLGGEVTVTTGPGTGTVVELEIPLSVAALDVLTVETGGITATIPIESVRGVSRVASGEIASGPDGASLVHRGEPVPFLPLDAAFDGGSSPIHGREAWPVVIVEGVEGMAAIGVQRLLGTSNIVIRPLPESFTTATVVSGVWLDTDGDPQLVLDPDGLVVSARRYRQGAFTERARPHPILVIDDSLTTRMLEHGILEGAGYEVESVSSSEAALERVRERRYALFLVDIELPEMDGFTFVEHTRADPVLREIPCIIMTSRSSPEDRRRGLEAGAYAYIAKGEFEQHQFLGLVRELVGG